MKVSSVATATVATAMPNNNTKQKKKQKKNAEMHKSLSWRRENDVTFKDSRMMICKKVK